MKICKIERIKNGSISCIKYNTKIYIYIYAQFITRSIRVAWEIHVSISWVSYKSTICLTTDGSARVDTSPNSDDLLAAIFLKTRRIILPERVLGRPGTTCVRK